MPSLPPPPPLISLHTGLVSGSGTAAPLVLTQEECTSEEERVDAKVGNS